MLPINGSTLSYNMFQETQTSVSKDVIQVPKFFDIDGMDIGTMLPKIHTHLCWSIQNVRIKDIFQWFKNNFLKLNDAIFGNAAYRPCISQSMDIKKLTKIENAHKNFYHIIFFPLTDIS